MPHASTHRERGAADPPGVARSRFPALTSVVPHFDTMVYFNISVRPAHARPPAHACASDMHPSDRDTGIPFGVSHMRPCPPLAVYVLPLAVLVHPPLRSLLTRAAVSLPPFIAASAADYSAPASALQLPQARLTAHGVALPPQPHRGDSSAALQFNHSCSLRAQSSRVSTSPLAPVPLCPRTRPEWGLFHVDNIRALFGIKHKYG